MDYQSKAVQDAVVFPVDDYVVSVHVASWAHVLPRIHGGEVEPPVAPYCRSQHIIRTSDSVVVVEVEARMTAYPRTIPFSQVEVVARETLLEMLEKDNVAPSPAAYAKGLKILTQRIVRQMQQRGVEITGHGDCGHKRRVAH